MNILAAILLILVLMASWLAQLIGLRQPDTGRVVRGDTVRFAYIDQHKRELDPEKTVLEEVAGPAEHVRVGERTLRIEGFLERFLFPGAMKYAKVGRLSGGEQSRVVLAKLLCQGGNVLVLDEPTNDLDLATLRTFEEALLGFPGAALIVSHDRWFLDRVATRIVHLDGEGGVRVHVGDFSSLLETLAREREELAAKERERERKSRPSASAGDKPKKKRLSPWEEKECGALPETIAKAEGELELLDGQLADPALYRGPKAETDRIRNARNALAAEIAKLYARWEELESLRGSSVASRK